MTLLDCYFHYKASACYPDLFFFSIEQYITEECLTREVQFHFTVKTECL